MSYDYPSNDWQRRFYWCAPDKVRKPKRATLRPRRVRLPNGVTIISTWYRPPRFSQPTSKAHLTEMAAQYRKWLEAEQLRRVGLADCVPYEPRKRGRKVSA